MGTLPKPTSTPTDGVASVRRSFDTVDTWATAKKAQGADPRHICGRPLESSVVWAHGFTDIPEAELVKSSGDS